MNDNITHTLILGSFFLLLFGFAEFLYHKLKVNSELTRKIVHLGTGLLTLFFPIWLTNHWFVLGLCSSFLLILILSLKFNLLPSINKVNRTTRGSILYPIIVYGCFLVFIHFNSLLYFYLPILILAICDPIAALIGKKFQLGHYKIFGHTKTFVGSAAFCISAFVVTAVGMSIFLSVPINELIFVSLITALATTFFEAISHKGYDNLTIPLSTLSVLLFFLN